MNKGLIILFVLASISANAQGFIVKINKGRTYKAREKVIIMDTMTFSALKYSSVQLALVNKQIFDLEHSQERIDSAYLHRTKELETLLHNKQDALQACMLMYQTANQVAVNNIKRNNALEKQLKRQKKQGKYWKGSALAAISVLILMLI